MMSGRNADSRTGCPPRVSIPAPVGVRDVRQRVDVGYAGGYLVGAQLVNGILHLRVDEAIFLASFLSSRAFLVPFGLLSFLVFDYQIGHRSNAADKGQGRLDDAFLICQLKIPERRVSQQRRDKKKCEDGEDDPDGYRDEQRDFSHLVLQPLTTSLFSFSPG